MKDTTAINKKDLFASETEIVKLNKWVVITEEFNKDLNIVSLEAKLDPKVLEISAIGSYSKDMIKKSNEAVIKHKIKEALIESILENFKIIKK